MSDLGLRMRLKAVDKLSAVNRRVAKSFQPLSAGAGKANRKFKILQGQSEKLRKSLSKTGGRMKSIGSGMTLALTAPIVGVGAAIIKTSANFQTGMNKVEALTGATGKSLDDMRKLARQLGRDTQFSATQAADAMGFLGMAGFNSNQILQATPGLLNLAAASGIELARAADIASNVMGAFNLDASKSGMVADVLAKTTASANVDMEMLAETFKDAAPVALKYGATIQDLAALTGKLGDAGIQGSKAGTTLKNMFLKISAPSKRAKQILGALGVEAVDPLTKKLRPMTNVLAQLNKGFKDKGLTQAQKLAVLNEVFGTRAIAGAGVLLESVKKIDPATGKVVDTVTELTNKLNGSNGAAKKMADTLMKGLPGAMKRLSSATEAMLLSFGFQGGFAGVAEAVIEKLIKLVNWFGSLDKTTMKLIGVVAGVVAVAGPMLTIFGVFLTMLPSMITGWNLLKAGMAGAKIAMMGLNLSALPLYAAVALLAGSAFLVYKNWKPIKSFLSDLFTHPLEQLMDLISLIGDVTGISSLFGDSVNEKLKKQGFTISDGSPKGKNMGAKELTKKSNEFKIRQQKSQVDVNFSNMPQGTIVSTEDKDNMLNIGGTGLIGAY